MKLIHFVLETSKDHTEEISPNQLEHPSMVEEILNAKEKCGPNLTRHLIQNSSLISHIDVVRKDLKKNSNVESEATTFIEFGAGRGQLSHWLSVGLPSSEDLRILMIDRGAQRYKCDSKMAEKSNVTQHRIRLDIADLDLQKVDSFKVDEGIHLAGGKHICGAATDLSLLCLVGSGVLSGSTGLVMALCCHHRCSWQPYVGKTFLMGLGLTETEFPALLGLTSWAVCGARPPKREPKSQGEENSDQEQNEDDALYPEHEAPTLEEGNRYQRLGVSISEREAIGLAAKALINRGRVSYLRERGLEASLVYYVSKELTLENVALVAHTGM